MPVAQFVSYLAERVFEETGDPCRNRFQKTVGSKKIGHTSFALLLVDQGLRLSCRRKSARVTWPNRFAKATNRWMASSIWTVFGWGLWLSRSVVKVLIHFLANRNKVGMCAGSFHHHFRLPLG